MRFLATIAAATVLAAATFTSPASASTASELKKQLKQKKHDIHHGADHELPIHSRHDWKQTFKQPYLYDNKTLPFWDLFDDAKLSKDFIRLAPSMPNSKGSVWARNSNDHREWHIEFQAHISGKGKVGSDGLAFWYTRERGKAGPILGSMDAWHGLGILIDSWDRDTDTANPYIFGVWDDGSKHLDGDKNKMGKILGGCHHDSRNSEKPFWIKVVYHADHRLQVFYDEDGLKWIPCFDAKDVILPTGYYFGLSAATGEHPDDHDVLAFETYELNPPYKAPKHKDHVMTYSEKRKAEQVHEVTEKAHDKDRADAQEHEYGHGADETSPASLQDLATTQWRIIESLDNLHARLDAARIGKGVVSTPSDHFSGDLPKEKVHEMLTKITGLAHEVTEIHESVTHHDAADSSNNLQHKVHELEAKLDIVSKGVRDLLELVNGQSSPIHHIGSAGGHGFFSYLFIIVSAQVLAALGYAAYQKYGNEIKKYN
ncbi:hypothetical protein GQ42DRAFT_165624 [Ramicandelaber brevisporus]|nr:hypothetical protein GQ42DRAFT_165624 [Ramicandelaber brevisporus]